MNSLCQTCRKLLYRTDPCRGDGVECGRTDGGSKKSTAARMDVPRRDELAGPVQNQDGGSPAPQNDPAGGAVKVSAGVESAGVGRVERPQASPRSNGSQAGTQAPPVDTKLGRPRDTGPSQGKSKRAAQMREYQRQRRANKKAKEAAK